MSTNRDPESGQFTSPQGEEPAPSQPEGSPTEQTPEGGWTPEQALAFIQQAGFDPGSNPNDIARRAANWAQLEDERTAQFAFRDLKQRFETPEPDPQENPWEQFQQPTPEPEQQMPQYPPNPQQQAPPSISPEQLQELMQYESQQTREQLAEELREENLINNLNYELTQTGVDDAEALQFMMNSAYQNAKQQGLHPHQAVEQAKSHPMVQAYLAQQTPEPGPSGDAPQEPPEGSAANPFQPPQNLEDAFNVTREFG